MENHMSKVDPEKSSVKDAADEAVLADLPASAAASEIGEAETEINAREGDNVVRDIDKAQEDGALHAELNVGKEVPPAEIHYTLESLSQDFEQFLSTLSAHKNEGEKGDDYLQIPQFVGKFLDVFEEKLAKYDSGECKMRWSEDPDEVSSLLEGVNGVSKLMGSLMEIKWCLDHHGPLINHAGSIQQRAMAFLEDEFRILLEEDKKIQNEKKSINAEQEQNQNQNEGACQDEKVEEGEEVGFEYPGYADEVVCVLRKMADHLIRGGYGSECREVYLVARRNILMQSLKDGEYEKVSIEEVLKMSWETLEREIPIWNKTFKDCSAVYFPGELNLAEKIFPGDNGNLFCIITHGLAIQLLGFAEAVAMTKRSTEKLFKILDIYETLRDNFEGMEGLFPEELRSELRNEASSARTRLGETAIMIFSDLEKSIKSDGSKTAVPGGAVHPLTRYTMNYLKYSGEYKETLEKVFKEHSKIENNNNEEGWKAGREEEEEEEKKREEEEEGGGGEEEKKKGQSRAFSKQLVRIMESLDANLEVKSKLYKDVSLSCIFMMNNGRYIVQKIRGSPEIHQVMGDTWCRRRSSDLRNYHKNYQRETWGKLLGCLSHEGLMNNGKIVKPNLKERFKSFNAMFDEIHRTQSTWVVNDEQLQSELRVSISAVVIPAYRSFLGRFAQNLDPGRQTEKYVKFQPEDIEDLIDLLFDGNASSSTIATKRRT